jgi:hypothetical protein
MLGGAVRYSVGYQRCLFHIIRYVLFSLFFTYYVSLFIISLTSQDLSISYYVL